MPQAATNPTSFRPLSQLIRDPFVRAAFERSERDGLAPVAVEATAPKTLTGGAVCVPEFA